MAPSPNQRHDSGRMETQLYLPVKRFLEARGFAVKGEICGCDLVAVPAAGANGAGSEAREGPAAGRHRRAEAELHPRAAAAGRGPAGGRRRDLAGGARLGGGRPQGARARARPAGAQMLPAARLRPARRVRPRAGGGDRGAAAVEAAQGGVAAPAPRRRAPAPAGRPGRRRQHAPADHDRLPAAGAGGGGRPRRGRGRRHGGAERSAGAPAARPQGLRPGRAEDPAAQRLRLVRARGARGVRADGGGAGGAGEVGGVA